MTVTINHIPYYIAYAYITYFVKWSRYVNGNNRFYYPTVITDRQKYMYLQAYVLCRLYLYHVTVEIELETSIMLLKTS